MNTCNEGLNYFLKRKLVLWISKRPKLFNNIRSGSFNSVLEVNPTQGIVFYLGCFDGRFLTSYYHGPHFENNAPALLRQLAAVISEASAEIEGEEFRIAITIALPPRSLKKILKVEKGICYLQV